jgi:hypothetical protein
MPKEELNAVQTSHRFAIFILSSFHRPRCGSQAVTCLKRTPNTSSNPTNRNRHAAAIAA